MKKRLAYFCVIALCFGSFCFLVCRGAEIKHTITDHSSVYPNRDEQLDVGLVKYHEQGRPGRIYPPFPRTITYPDCYVPVLIPKSEVGRVKQLLGHSFLVLSPGIDAN